VINSSKGVSSELPVETSRGYYLYLLDYGWEEPLGRALHDNFDSMADRASHHDAAVLVGVGHEFNDEVLSWHDINGRSADDILPAILITNKHPASFVGMRGAWDRQGDHLVLIPLRDRCKTPTDVARLIDRIFNDIKASRPLAEFAVAREDRASIKGAILDAVVLRPTVGGFGIDLKALFRRFRKGGGDGE